MKRLLDVAVIVSALCAVVITGLVVRKEFFAPRAPSEQAAPRAVANWEQFASAGQHMGAPRPRVVLVEFSDFQCPYCRVFSETLHAVEARHPRDLEIVYRHYPLQAIHPYARGAALAAECAGAQDRFEAYHDRLFSHQDSIGKRTWERFAGDAGVPDTERFRECVARSTFVGRLHADSLAAVTLGLSSTPSVLIDGKLYRGAIPESELDQLVSDALSHAR